VNRLENIFQIHVRQMAGKSGNRSFFSDVIIKSALSTGRGSKWSAMHEIFTLEGQSCSVKRRGSLTVMLALIIVTNIRQ
jgi:hypothetical protein